MNEARSSGHLGRSILAIAAGIVVGVVLTLITDAVLHKAGFFPPLGERTANGPLVVATAYRIVYSMFGSYLIAWLAPNKPMGHALISGWIGVIVSTAGAIATWNRDLGPHWYPLALIVTALPCAWAGAKLRIVQLRSQPASTHAG